MPLNFCVVYEDEADAELASELADRVILENTDWLTNDSFWLDSQRCWTKVAPTGRRLRWIEIDNLGRQMKLPVRRYEKWVSDRPDYRSAIRALRVIKALFDEVAAVVLIRDVDDQVERLDGLKDARAHYYLNDGVSKVVVGVANTKRECWVLSGFDPSNDLETNLLAEERQFLGFNPVERPHELTAKHDEVNDKRSAKRVLKKLTQANFSREQECWTDTPLSTLRARGKSKGLTEYLDEVKEILVPLFIRPEGRREPA